MSVSVSVSRLLNSGNNSLQSAMELLLFLSTCVVMVTMSLSRKPQIIDLTHELFPDFPVYPVYPRFNFTTLVRGQHAGGFWLEYNFFSTVEHMGTHMDAPVHLSRGNRAVNQIPIERFIGPGIIIRVTDKVKNNLVYQVSVDDILEWEAKYGFVPSGAIVMMDAGWTHRVHDAKLMFGTNNPTDVSTFHTPSFSAEAARFLARRKVSMVGVDTISIDPGNAMTFPAHLALLPLGIMVLENVANLDKVPEAGSIIYCMPLNLRGGSGAPMRAFAIINDDIMLTPAAAGRISVSYASMFSLIGLTLYLLL